GFLGTKVMADTPMVSGAETEMRLRAQRPSQSPSVTAPPKKGGAKGRKTESREFFTHFMRSE
ncbi:MAG: hypothetical protein IJP11_00485, partial [Oscillospiraceae bacterium]|nr:hypothetical protein [Oscillospiraceae bacterium]